MSIEQLLRADKPVEAKKAYSNRMDDLYKTQLNLTDAELLEAAQMKHSVEKYERLTNLTKQRDSLLKTQSQVDNPEKLNRIWYNDQLGQLNQRFGKNIPPELLASAKAIYNEANSLAVSLEADKAQKKASDIIQQKNYEAASLLEQNKPAEAIVKFEEIKSEIRMLQDGGVYTPEDANKEIKALERSHAGTLVGSAIGHTNDVLLQEGFEEALKTFNQYKATLSPYLKNLPDSVKNHVAKTEAFFKAGNDDSVARIIGLEQAYQNALTYKNGGPSKAQNLAYKQRKILSGQLGDPHLTPAEKAKINNKIKGLNGRIILNKHLTKAVNREGNNFELIKGVGFDRFKEITGIKDPLTLASAWNDYVKSRSGYDNATDHNGATYHYYNDLAERVLSNDVIERAEDEIKVTGGISNQSVNRLSDIYTDPRISDEMKLKIAGLTNSEQLSSAVAKKHIPGVNDNVASFMFANTDVFQGMQLQDFPQMKNFIQNQTGAKTAYNKLQSYLLAEKTGVINRLSEAHNVTPAVIAGSIAMYMVVDIGKHGGALAGGAGLDLETINRSPMDALGRSKQISTSFDMMQENLEGKRSVIGEQTYSKKQGNPFDANPQVKHYVEGLFADDDKDIPFAPDFLVKPFLKDKISLNSRTKVQDTIRKVTGLKDLNTINRLRFRENSDATGMILQIVDANGVTRRDLMYDGEREPLFISYDVLYGDFNEEQFINAIKKGVLKGAD